MNALPVVTVTRADDGTAVACTCGWHHTYPDRVTADLVARRHRASHGKGA